MNNDIAIGCKLFFVHKIKKINFGRILSKIDNIIIVTSRCKSFLRVRKFRKIKRIWRIDVAIVIVIINRYNCLNNSLNFSLLSFWKFRTYVVIVFLEIIIVVVVKHIDRIDKNANMLTIDRWIIVDRRIAAVWLTAII